jgi:hypothetical protein
MSEKILDRENARLALANLELGEQLKRTQDDYNKSEAENKKLRENLPVLLAEFATEQQGLILTGYSPEEWEELKQEAREFLKNKSDVRKNE